MNQLILLNQTIFNETGRLFFNNSFVDTKQAVTGMAAYAYIQTFQSSVHGVISSKADFHLKSTSTPESLQTTSKKSAMYLYNEGAEEIDRKTQ